MKLGLAFAALGAFLLEGQSLNADQALINSLNDSAFVAFLEQKPAVNKFLMETPAASEWLRGLPASSSYQPEAQLKKSLTPKQLDVLGDYAAGHYYSTSESLRKGLTCDSKCEELVQTLHGLQKFDGVVFRGIHFQDPNLADKYLQTGRTVSDLGFMSTSVDNKIAWGFKGAGRGSIFLVVNSHGGAEIPNDSEGEVLFPPGSPLRIDLVMTNQDGSHIVFATDLGAQVQLLHDTDHNINSEESTAAAAAH